MSREALAKLSFTGAAQPTFAVNPAKITNPSFTKPVLPASFRNLKLVNFFIIILPNYSPPPPPAHALRD
jgi:hypothetical protein